MTIRGKLLSDRVKLAEERAKPQEMEALQQIHANAARRGVARSGGVVTERADRRVATVRALLAERIRLEREQPQLSESATSWHDELVGDLSDIANRNVPRILSETDADWRRLLGGPLPDEIEGKLTDDLSRLRTEYLREADLLRDERELRHPRPTSEGTLISLPSTDTRRVFVVYGRNTQARDAMFTFLGAIGLQPIEWSEAIRMTGEASPYVGKILDTVFSAARAIVVLLTPDEIAYLRSEYAGPDDNETRPATQVRPNVLFEAGMAMGRDPGRTILVQLGDVRPFSDVAGRHFVILDNTPVKRKELAQRLLTTGCAVSTSGEHWLSAGDFTPPPPPGGGLPLGKRVPSGPTTAGVRLDIRYHPDSGRAGWFEIVNLGSEPVHDVDIEIPAEAGSFHVFKDDFPLPALPAGKSARLRVIREEFGKDHFEIRVTGRTLENIPVSEKIFVSMAGR